MGKLKINQLGFSAVEVLAMLIIVGAIAAAGFLAFNSKHNTNKTVQNTTQQTSTNSICDHTSDKIGCMVNGFEVSAPAGGETVCLGSNYTVKWKAPSSFETVTLTLREDSSSGAQYSLGAFPASKGEYDWPVRNVKPSEVYRMWINSVYKGQSVNNASQGMFTVKSC